MVSSGSLKVRGWAALVLLSGCVVAQAAAPRKAEAKKAEPRAVEAPVITLGHVLGEAQEAQLTRLVGRFNAQSKIGQIALAETGPGSVLNVVREADEAAWLGNGTRTKPLWQVMRESGAPLAAQRAPAYLVPSVLDEAGRLRALPLALSTPVVFYNRKALAQAGAEAPARSTWNDWQGVLGQVLQSGQSCPMTVAQPVSSLIENAGAWNNQPFVAPGKRERIAANGLMYVKHLAKMSTWYKSQYLQTFGRGDEALAHFAAGECAVMVAPSGAYAALRGAEALDLGVAAYPYHDDAYGAPQNTWADGPALWVSSGRPAAEYKLVAAFVRFWLSAQTQGEWSEATGYLPLNAAGLPAPAAAGSSVLSVAQAQLLGRPGAAAAVATAYAHRTGVRAVLAEEMEAVFAGRKPAKQGLDDAVGRLSGN